MNYKITKEVKIDQKKVVLKLEVELDPDAKYSGYDLFPDDMIGDVFVAVGQDFKHGRSWDKINRKFKGETNSVKTDW